TRQQEREPLSRLGEDRFLVCVKEFKVRSDPVHFDCHTRLTVLGGKQKGRAVLAHRQKQAGLGGGIFQGEEGPLFVHEQHCPRVPPPVVKREFRLVVHYLQRCPHLPMPITQNQALRLHGLVRRGKRWSGLAQEGRTEQRNAPGKDQDQDHGALEGKRVTLELLEAGQHGRILGEICCHGRFPGSCLFGIGANGRRPSSTSG